MPFVDPRTDLLQAVFGVGAHRSLIDATYVTSEVGLRGVSPSQDLGRVAYLYGRAKDGRQEILRSRVGGSALGGLSPVLGFSGNAAAEGQGIFQVQTSLLSDINQKLGYAYLGPLTNGDIHSAEHVVTRGTNVVKLNRAAGGYISSWTVGGVEILSRGDSWGRGIQSQLEWAEATSGRMVLHRPSQAACRFNSGSTALGSHLLSITEHDDLLGGHHVTAKAIPLELDPDGELGVPGVSTDHGGDEGRPVIWRDVRVTTDLWMDYAGIEGLHRLQTTWETPFSVLSAFLDCAAQTALCLNGEFNEVAVHDTGLDATTVVTGPVDAVDFRRWSVSSAATFQDEVTFPSSPSILTSAFGGVYARNTATDLTVFLSGRMHPIDVSQMDLSLSDIRNGNQVTAMTNRAGATGLDGEQVVVLGLDSNLTSRWYNHDQTRRLRRGSETFTRWISVGSRAQALALASSIPKEYP